VLAYLFFSRKPGLAASPASSVGGSLLRRWWLAGWGFDWVYDRLLVRPFVWIATVNRTDFIEGFYNALAHGSVLLHRIFSRTENGLVRWYAAGIGIGAIVILAIVVLS
jgi:NADH-quinone oxidoreductase subunit L